MVLFCTYPSGAHILAVLSREPDIKVPARPSVTARTSSEWPNNSQLSLYSSRLIPDKYLQQNIDDEASS